MLLHSGAAVLYLLARPSPVLPLLTTSSCCSFQPREKRDFLSLWGCCHDKNWDPWEPYHSTACTSTTSCLWKGTPGQRPDRDRGEAKRLGTQHSSLAPKVVPCAFVLLLYTAVLIIAFQEAKERLCSHYISQVSYFSFCILFPVEFCVCLEDFSPLCLLLEKRFRDALSADVLQKPRSVSRYCQLQAGKGRTQGLPALIQLEE